MAMFFNKGKPNLKSERYYEDYEPQGFQLSRYVKFSAFVVVALVLVAAVIISMVAFNLKNNTLVMFNKASSKNFDCGSFSYQLNAKLNDELYMMYDGAIEFDLHDRKIESVYHAVYKDYEYDAVTYAQDSKAIRGNYYNGKWTTEDYSDRALDFFGFYNEYRRGKLDAGAAVRFTQTNDKFAARSLKTSIESIIKELSKPTNMNAVMHQKMVVADGDTTITFNPEMDKVFDIIIKHIGPAYTSANEFAIFKAAVENSMDNLQKTDCEIKYTINGKGYLSYLYISYTVDGDNYVVEINMGDFKEAETVVPESFFAATSIE